MSHLLKYWQLVLLEIFFYTCDIGVFDRKLKDYHRIYSIDGSTQELWGKQVLKKKQDA